MNVLSVVLVIMWTMAVAPSAMGAEMTPAQKLCSLWNKEKNYTSMKCKPQGEDAVFEVADKRENEIWGRYEFSVLRKALGRGNVEGVTLVLRTSDGMCRRISRKLESEIREGARQGWEEIGKPIPFDEYWQRKAWDAAPKAKCGEAQSGYVESLPPDLGLLRSSPPAKMACALVVWNEWNKGCESVSDKKILVWNLDYAYKHEMSKESLSQFEWMKLSPVLFFYWAVKDYAKLDSISVRLKNGKCKTVSRELGLELDRKWMERYRRDGRMTQDRLMTSWFEDGWGMVIESECPGLPGKAVAK